MLTASVRPKAQQKPLLTSPCSAALLVRCSALRLRAIHPPGCETADLYERAAAAAEEEYLALTLPPLSVSDLEQISRAPELAAFLNDPTDSEESFSALFSLYRLGLGLGVG